MFNSTMGYNPYMTNTNFVNISFDKYNINIIQNKNIELEMTDTLKNIRFAENTDKTVTYNEFVQMFPYEDINIGKTSTPEKRGYFYINPYNFMNRSFSNFILYMYYTKNWDLFKQFIIFIKLEGTFKYNNITGLLYNLNFSTEEYLTAAKEYAVTMIPENADLSELLLIIEKYNKLLVNNSPCVSVEFVSEIHNKSELKQIYIDTFSELTKKYYTTVNQSNKISINKVILKYKTEIAKKMMKQQLMK